MTPERWQQVETLFHRTVDLEPEARAAWLDSHCTGDPALRREVEALLDSDQARRGSLREAVAREAVRLLQGADASGERLGAWRLLRPLKHGGMGAVYLAARADDAYRKQVAVKLLQNTLATEYERERFRAERQILAGLEHACIARLIDGGTRADGSPYLVMEYVDGQPIDRYCDEHRLSLEERLRLFQQVCRAVAHAHRQHVVHRDLKPGNILVGTDGVPKLLDFGIAKLLDPAGEPQAGPATRAEDRRLTPEYASPEQLSGAASGFAGDIYALGVVLYELLTGCLPYQLNGLSFDEMLRAVRETDPLPPSAALARREPGGAEPARRLHGDLDNIVMKALRREPHARYADADELAADIERYVAGEPVLARAEAPLERFARFVRRRRTQAIVGVLLLACAVLAALYVKALSDAERRIKALVASHASAQAIEHLPGIAILPFRGAQDGAALGSGMSEDLIASLSALAGLRVTAFNSVRHYPEAAPDPAAVARELGVRYVVSGSVEQSAGRLAIEAVLNDAEIGRRLWSARYDRAAEDVFAIQTELAEKLAASLGIELTADERRQFARRPTRSIEAYKALLQGLPNYGQRLRAANEEARRHFERALALDPGYARAYATLANTYRAEFANDWSENPAQALARAEHLASRALAIDDGLAQAHFVMGLVRREQRRHTEALAAAARAVVLDPNYADGMVLMASVLCYDGKTENTVGLIQRAVRLNPRFPVNYPFHLGQCYFAMGRYEEAIAAFRQALDRNPLSERELLWLAAAYALAGRLADAQWTVSELQAGGRRLSLRRVEPTIPFTRREHLERLLEGLRRAGVPE
jgi:serine/threonine protein kinase/TolB-like protein/Tfp pilus assembly protein PilF